MAYCLDLSGRIALVTGAAGGLGAQFACTLARAGAAVVLASRRMERLKDLRARIEGEGGDAHVVELDVTDIDSIRAAVAHGLRQGLRVNAGHGLNLANVTPIAALAGIAELNIGHAIVAQAVFDGWEKAIRDMKALMVEARLQAVQASPMETA